MNKTDCKHCNGLGAMGYQEGGCSSFTGDCSACRGTGELVECTACGWLYAAGDFVDFVFRCKYCEAGDDARVPTDPCIRLAVEQEHRRLMDAHTEERPVFVAMVAK